MEPTVSSVKSVGSYRTSRRHIAEGRHRYDSHAVTETLRFKARIMLVITKHNPIGTEQEVVMLCFNAVLYRRNGYNDKEYLLGTEIHYFIAWCTISNGRAVFIFR
jgi:hypothetical protein